MKNNNTRFIPFLLAICLIAGIAIGTFYANHFSGNKLGIINTSSNKLNALLRIIDDQYVDTVNMGELVEEAMPQILSELDPHSSYIPAKDLEAVNADLKGSFSGIGIQFTIQNDTIHVNSVIQGGPSEKVGLMAGDRIVEGECHDWDVQEVPDVLPDGPTTCVSIIRTHSTTRWTLRRLYTRKVIPLPVTWYVWTKSWSLAISSSN